MGRPDIKEEVCNAVLEVLPNTAQDGLGFNELLRELEERGVTNSPTTLSKYLTEMEDKGLVKRKTIREKPPRIIKLWKDPRKIEEIEKRNQIINHFEDLVRPLTLPELSFIESRLRYEIPPTVQAAARLMTFMIRRLQLRGPLMFILQHKQEIEDAVKKGFLDPDTPFGYAVRKYLMPKQLKVPKSGTFFIKENGEETKFEIRAVSIEEALSIAEETKDEFTAHGLLAKKALISPVLSLEEINSLPAKQFDMIERCIQILSGCSPVSPAFEPYMTLKEAFEAGILNPNMTLEATVRKLQGLETKLFNPQREA